MAEAADGRMEISTDPGRLDRALERRQIGHACVTDDAPGLYASFGFEPLDDVPTWTAGRLRR